MCKIELFFLLFIYLFKFFVVLYKCYKYVTHVNHKFDFEKRFGLSRLKSMYSPWSIN